MQTGFFSFANIFFKFKLITYFKCSQFAWLELVIITHWFHIDQNACLDELIYIFFVQPGFNSNSESIDCIENREYLGQQAGFISNRLIWIYLFQNTIYN